MNLVYLKRELSRLKKCFKKKLKELNYINFIPLDAQLEIKSHFQSELMEPLLS